jgi:DNA replication protein DnaC
MTNVIDKMRDNPGAISDRDLKTAIQRLQTSLQANMDGATETERPRVATDAHAKALSELERGDFPLRHRNGLESMTGPGLARAKSLIPRAKRDSMFLLAGTRGNGKTQLATYLAYQRRVAHGKPAGRYIKALNLFEALKESWGSRKTEDSILRPYRSAGLLVIDEIHERGESDWENRKLVNLLDHRYDRMLVTILLGNIEAGRAEAELSPSIISRMKETGGVIECDWPSYR